MTSPQTQSPPPPSYLQALSALADPVAASAVPLASIGGRAAGDGAAPPVALLAPLAPPRRRSLPATREQLLGMMGRDGEPLHTDGILLYNATALVASAGPLAGTRRGRRAEAPGRQARAATPAAPACLPTSPFPGCPHLTPRRSQVP